MVTVSEKQNAFHRFWQYFVEAVKDGRMFVVECSSSDWLEYGKWVCPCTDADGYMVSVYVTVPSLESQLEHPYQFNPNAVRLKQDAVQEWMDATFPGLKEYMTCNYQCASADGVHPTSHVEVSAQVGLRLGHIDTLMYSGESAIKPTESKDIHECIPGVLLLNILLAPPLVKSTGQVCDDEETRFLTPVGSPIGKPEGVRKRGDETLPLSSPGSEGNF